MQGQAGGGVGEAAVREAEKQETAIDQVKWLAASERTLGYTSKVSIDIGNTKKLKREISLKYERVEVLLTMKDISKRTFK